MITQRALSVRLKKDGIRHMTDFEDMSNDSACTSMGSSECPIFFLDAYALLIIRWIKRTMAREEEHLPLLQGQTPSGLVCDLGLSAFADDVAKKIVGRSEEELFEALVCETRTDSVHFLKRVCCGVLIFLST